MNEDGHVLCPAEHQLYLLRVWYELDGAQPVWRASILLHADPQRRYFATPDALLHFLGQHLQNGQPAGVGEGRGGAP